MFEGIDKERWYKWSMIVNVALFFFVGVFLYLLVIDSIYYARMGGDSWLRITRDIGFIAVALSLIFFQFFRNLRTIIRRKL